MSPEPRTAHAAISRHVTALPDDCTLGALLAWSIGTAYSRDEVLAAVDSLRADGFLTVHRGADGSEVITASRGGAPAPVQGRSERFCHAAHSHLRPTTLPGVNRNG